MQKETEPEDLPEEHPLSLRRERLARIADMVKVHGAVRVTELSALFRVSEVTIRNDLDAMASEGILVRDRGGAVAHPGTALSIAFENRALNRRDVKRMIGRAAVSQLKAGESILMDAGTTLMEMARSIPEDLPLTVVTNAINLALHVGALPLVKVVIAGGMLSRENIETVGPLAERDLTYIVADKAFMGAHAIDTHYGITDVSLEIARVKQTMCSAAREVILLADSSKWGQYRFARVLPLTAFHRVITDDGLPESDRRWLEDQGIAVTIAGDG